MTQALRTTLDPAGRLELIDVAHRLADVARAATLPLFRGDALATQNKHAAAAGGGFDPVTAADRAAEQQMRALLARLRPGDAVLGEELPDRTGTSGLRWILDPIDGTRGFLSGTPTWGVLIAVADAQGPFLGIIDQPYIGERFLGGLGQARLDAPHGSRTLRTRAPRPLSEAVLFSTFPEIGTAQEQAAFRRVAGRVQLVRYGMDCYAYALLAAGHVDLVIEAGLHAFDIAAPIAVIEAAGGLVTDWQGGPAHDGGQVLAAANAQVHAAALKLLAGA